MSFFGKLFSSQTGLKNALSTGRVTIGSNFQLSCRFFFTGPGRLEIDDNVIVKSGIWDKNHFVTFSTYHPDAIIKVGKNTVLEGTRMGCRNSIDIGAECYIGEASIMDTDFHSLDYLTRDDQKFINVGSVKIEPKVRIGHGCHILRGVTIGEGTVVRPMSVVCISLPSGIVTFGYPAR